MIIINMKIELLRHLDLANVSIISLQLNLNYNLFC